MKLYTATASPPMHWTKWHNSPEWKRGALLTGRLQVYIAVHDAGDAGISRLDIIQKTGLKPHTVSFYLSKYKATGHIVVKGEAAGQAKQGGVTANMPFEQARDITLLSLENTLVIKAREKGITDDMRKAFVVYQKAKAHVLAPPNANATPAEHDGAKKEADMALKLALKKIIDAVF